MHRSTSPYLLILCITAVFSFTQSRVSAQQFHIKNYGINDGLAGISVTCLLQDSRGYIWIGTKDGGVSRFDGKTFVNYNKQSGIGDNTVNCLFEDKTGNIWIGTQKNGVTKFNGYEFIQYNGSSVKNIDKIFSDSSGAVLLYSYPEVYAFEGDSIVLKTTGNNTGVLQKFLQDGGPKAYSSLTDKSGNKWIATYTGIYIIKKEFTDREDAYEHRTQFILNSENTEVAASCLMQDREGNIWIGTDFNGLYMFYDGAFSNFNNIPSLKKVYITAVKQFDGGVVLGTSEGLKKIIYNEKTQQFSEVNYKIPGFTSASQINCIYTNGDVLMIAADENNNFIQYNGNYSHFRIAEIPDATQITAITIDNNNVIWIGTNNNGVFLKTNTGVLHYTKEDSLSSDFISTLFRDSKGNIWIGTEDAGVIKYDGNYFTGLYFGEIENIVDDI